MNTCPLSHSTATTSHRTVRTLVETLLTGVGLTIALGLTAFNPPAAKGQEPSLALKQPTASIVTAPSSEHRSLPDGTYLYGQSTKADQLGSAYLVFQVRNRQVVGAAYMPGSSFDCFHGEMKVDQLALTVVDSYQQSRHPFSVALKREAIATTGRSTSTTQLQGYHPIRSISKNDARMLTVCQADYQKSLVSQR